MRLMLQNTSQISNVLDLHVKVKLLEFYSYHCIQLWRWNGVSQNNFTIYILVITAQEWQKEIKRKIIVKLAGKLFFFAFQPCFSSTSRVMIEMFINGPNCFFRSSKHCLAACTRDVHVTCVWRTLRRSLDVRTDVRAGHFHIRRPSAAAVGLVTLKESEVGVERFTLFQLGFASAHSGIVNWTHPSAFTPGPVFKCKQCCATE